VMHPCAPLRASWIKKIEVVRIPDCPVLGDCWIWHGARDKVTGYGRVQFGGTCKYLHRLSYQFFNGAIPAGLHTDHLCRQRACCAPYHLEAVTPKVNSERGIRATKTHCPQGHEYAGENLRIQRDSRGYRRRTCVQCNRDKSRQHNAARKAARETTWAKYAYLLEPAAMEIAS
jgi:hypothetical protein